MSDPPPVTPIEDLLRPPSGGLEDAVRHVIRPYRPP